MLEMLHVLNIEPSIETLKDVKFLNVDIRNINEEITLRKKDLGIFVTLVDIIILAR